MNILYVAPRFHTNMEETIKGFIKNNDSVQFWVSYAGKIESCSVLSPITMKSSLVFKVVLNYQKRKYGDCSKIEHMIIKWFCPNLFFVIKGIRNFRPDVIIVRERNLASMVVTFVSRLLRVKKVILYNQVPLYLKSTSVSLKKNLARKLFPNIRYTPVVTNSFIEFCENRDSFVKDKNTFFLPLVGKDAKPNMSREYKPDSILRILDVGKYREYKNHKLLVDAVSKMSVHQVYVTIVGQCFSDEEKKYYSSLVDYIKSKGLEDNFFLIKNYPFEKMEELYLTHDVLVLASIRECASVSICEAMANGLIAVSPDTNGTASYLGEGAGFIYRENDSDSLSKILDEVCLMTREQIKTIGQKARFDYEQKYSFLSYLNGLSSIIESGE